VHSSTGGLVTALVPLLGNRKGMWIGWPGVLEETNVDELLKVASQAYGYILRPVLLTPEEVEQALCRFFQPDHMAAFP
jgi:trehalose 6-phosphate synthase